MRVLRRLAAAAVLLAAVVASPAGAGVPAVQPPPVYLPAYVPVPLAGQPIPTNMAYYGGAVLLHPHVYLGFWGWRDDQTGARKRLIAFFRGVGGSAWENVVTQYYENDNGRDVHIQNPRNQLAGVWDDRRGPAAGTLPDKAISVDALRLAQHFHAVHDPNAVFLVATPSYASTDYKGGGYCAYHGYADGIAYVNLPFAVATDECGGHAVNQDGGALDGVSIVAGHEYLEAITDPGTGAAGIGTGWRDLDYNENADKCAWVAYGPGKMTNITLSTGVFAVQGSWSNDAGQGTGACATE
jgi:serine protease